MTRGTTVLVRAGVRPREEPRAHDAHHHSRRRADAGPRRARLGRAGRLLHPRVPFLYHPYALHTRTFCP